MKTCANTTQVPEPNCVLRMPGSDLGLLIGVDAFGKLEHHLRAQRVRLAQEMPAAQSEPGSFTAADHSKVEQLAQIDAALMRLVDGRYGACFACGGSIAIERLRLLPATLFCLRCARRRPRGSRIDAAHSVRRFVRSFFSTPPRSGLAQRPRA